MTSTLFMSTRKVEILRHAARLFRQKGYQATSLKDIAREVGVEAPSLYNHINSKHEILKDILLDIASKFVSSIQDVDHASLKGINKIEKAISQYVNLSYNHPNEISLITGEWVHLEDADLKTYLDFRDQYETAFRNMYRQAVKECDIKEVNEDVAIFSILSTLRWIYSWINKNRRYNVVELESQLITILIDGLRR